MKMTRRILVTRSILALAVAPLSAMSQQARVHRVGVVSLGGAYATVIDGLRDGLKALGMEQGKHYVLDARDLKGDLAAVAGAARSLEDARVDLIYSVATSVTQAVKRATSHVPIVFYVGSDPVAFGLVESFAKPGGRLTGVHGQFTDLTAKRLQLLKEIVPNLRRVLVFYNPANPAARQSMTIARDAARALNVELVERQVASVDDLRAALRALKAGEVDAFCYVADAMVNSQAPLVIDTARAKALPTMFSTPENAAGGALASYGVSYYTFGHLSAKHVQRVLLGTRPSDLPVEQIDKLRFVINLRTARALRLAVPSTVLARADDVLE
jgi:putative ABC transport system substrate-binding protein